MVRMMTHGAGGAYSPQEVGYVLTEAGIPGIRYLDQGSRGNAFRVDLSTSRGPYASQSFATREQAEQYAADKAREGFATNIADVGSRNYSIFDPRIIEIVRRYGLVPGALGAGAAASSLMGDRTGK